MVKVWSIVMLLCLYQQFVCHLPAVWRHPCCIGSSGLFGAHCRSGSGFADWLFLRLGWQFL